MTTKNTLNPTFSQYIEETKKKIVATRVDVQPGSPNGKIIVEANAPFELNPTPLPTHHPRLGALLIHGLFDSPFSLKDLGHRLQLQGIRSKAVLLSGHGTNPKDLTSVHYHEWIDVVRYGIDALSEEVDEIYLIGYSTGATLAAYHALTDKRIQGLILLSPAIRIKAPVDVVVGLHKLFSLGQSKWVYQEDEIDYAKYQSIPFNAVKQVSCLTKKLMEEAKHHPLKSPLFMIMSEEDETISSHSAIELFMQLQNHESRLLLYTAAKKQFPDPRIIVRHSSYPELHIKNFAHISLPFAKDNPHYGQNGDYIHASHIGEKNVIFGAYNRIEARTYHLMQRLGIAKKSRRALTYNPDFDFMMQKIFEFIARNGKNHRSTKTSADINHIS